MLRELMNNDLMNNPSPLNREGKRFHVHPQVRHVHIPHTHRMNILSTVRAMQCSAPPRSAMLRKSGRSLRSIRKRHCMVL